MFATMVTCRDTLQEGVMYVSDDLGEAQQIGQLLMKEHSGIFMGRWGQRHYDVRRLCRAVVEGHWLP